MRRRFVGHIVDSPDGVWVGRRDVTALCGKRLRRAKVRPSPWVVCSKCATAVMSEANERRKRPAFTVTWTGGIAS